MMLCVMLWNVMFAEEATGVILLIVAQCGCLFVQGSSIIEQEEGWYREMC